MASAGFPRPASGPTRSHGPSGGGNSKHWSSTSPARPAPSKTSRGKRRYDRGQQRRRTEGPIDDGPDNIGPTDGSEHGSPPRRQVVEAPEWHRGVGPFTVRVDEADRDIVVYPGEREDIVKQRVQQAIGHHEEEEQQGRRLAPVADPRHRNDVPHRGVWWLELEEAGGDLIRVDPSESMADLLQRIGEATDRHFVAQAIDRQREEEREQYLVDALVAEERERKQDEEKHQAAAELERKQRICRRENFEGLGTGGESSSMDNCPPFRSPVGPEVNAKQADHESAVGISFANFDISAMLPSAAMADPSKVGPPSEGECIERKEVVVPGRKDRVSSPAEATDSLAATMPLEQDDLLLKEEELLDAFLDGPYEDFWDGHLCGIAELMESDDEDDVAHSPGCKGDLSHRQSVPHERRGAGVIETERLDQVRRVGGSPLATKHPQAPPERMQATPWDGTAPALSINTDRLKAGAEPNVVSPDSSGASTTRTSTAAGQQMKQRKRTRRSRRGQRLNRKNMEAIEWREPAVMRQQKKCVKLAKDRNKTIRRRKVAVVKEEKEGSLHHRTKGLPWGPVGAISRKQ